MAKNNTIRRGPKKVTSIGDSKFSRPMKKKKDWKRGVSKYRGQGK